MDEDVIDPALREATLKLRVPDVGNRVVMGVVRVATALLKPVQTPGVTISTVKSGSTSLRIYRPDRILSDGGLLWIHGGGLVMGVAKQDDPLCGSVAAELGIVVVSAEYGLAPKNVFPAALDELTESWRWFQQHAAELGADGSRIVIGGESAGGGLAASLVQRIHDGGGVQPIAQWLFSPMLDDRTAADRDLDGVDHWVWNNAANRVGWSGYLGQRPAGPPNRTTPSLPGEPISAACRRPGSRSATSSCSPRRTSNTPAVSRRRAWTSRRTWSPAPRTVSRTTRATACPPRRCWLARGSG